MEEWLNKRKKGIGGSDASAILGLNPYMTNQDLWRLKTGRESYKDISDKEFVIYGNKLEPVLIDLFEADNPEYQIIDKEEAKNNKFHNFIKHPKDEFLFGNLDAIVINKQNKKGVLEIKTCQINKYNSDKWKDGIPINYYCQVLHYMNVTGFDYGILYALLKYFTGEIKIKTYKFLREELQDEIDYLHNVEINFWNQNILQDKEPNLLIKLK